MMLAYVAPMWVESLAQSLENKYRAEVGNTNLLDLMVEYWIDHQDYAFEFMNDIGASSLEIKAWLYSKGNDMFEDELQEVYIDQLM